MKLKGLLVLAGVLLASQAQAQFSGYYRIMARHSGKALAVQGASTANSANVIQSTYGGASTNDEWELRDIGSGYSRVINRNSGRDMVVQSASTAEGANIFQYAYGGSNTNDEWSIVDVGSGYYRITNRLSGKSVEVASGSTAESASVNQRTYSGATYQQFQIVSLSGVATPTPTPTPVPGATATPTPVPTATPTPPPAGGGSYEAEAGTLAGAARTVSCTACSGAMKVGYIGNGAANTLTFPSVSVGASGTYSMRIDGLVSGTRSFQVSINGGSTLTIPVTGTSFSAVTSVTVNVSLTSGSNSIRVFNDSAYAPDLDRIVIGSAGTPTATPTPTPTPTPGPTATAPPPGTFPSRTFAPYIETWNNRSLTSIASATGHKYYTLAFIINGSGTCNPTWNGDTALGTYYRDHINGLRAAGGDVIVSFGGASGTELGLSCTSVSSLQAAYQKVIDTYGVKWLDLDIEGGAMGNTGAIDRRNKAIAALQAANSGLRISYTLAVDRTGLPSGEVNLLKNAQTNGARVDVVNIMAMDYGPCYSDMGQAAIDAASATRSQLSGIGMNAKVGVTPMINVNDVTCENFKTSDSQLLLNYAQANSYISHLAFWSLDADISAGYPHTKILKAFH